jgi:hypothetical protein
MDRGLLLNVFHILTSNRIITTLLCIEVLNSHLLFGDQILLALLLKFGHFNNNTQCKARIVTVKEGIFITDTSYPG